MQPPFHRLEEFVSLLPSDFKILDGWCASRRHVPRGTLLRREDDAVSGVFFLMEGWVTSSLMMRSGRRQIVKVHLPGDMLGVPSLALMNAGETLDALSDVIVCHIPPSELGDLFEKSPRIARGLFLSTQKERVALMHGLSWIGSASARERLAAFLLDLFDRLEAAGLVVSGRFEMPLTQQHLGELLGLTAIHVNRTLRSLDETGYVLRTRGWIRITDLAGLRSLAPNSAPRFAGRAAWARLDGKPGAAGRDA